MYIYYKVTIFVIIALVVGCKDKEPICNCIGNGALVMTEEGCHCPENYYEMGSFSDNCDTSSNKIFGNCIERQELNYKMLHNCDCSSLTLTDSLIIRFGDFKGAGGINYETKFSSSGFHPMGSTFFKELEGGNEFRVKFSSDWHANNYVNFKECEGNSPGLIGIFIGKFNSDNTYCNAKIYWKNTDLPDSEILDSCDVWLSK